MESRKGIIAAGTALYVLALCILALGAAGMAGPLPRRAAPPFRLADTAGKTHTLAEYRGRPTVLFFFCGCPPCHACAGLWAQAEASETPAPVTLVVYSGSSAAANLFARQTGLRPGRDTLLSDPQGQVGARYHVSLCPRVFVLDAQGRIRYTNDVPGTNPQTTSAVMLVSAALTALRRVEQGRARQAPIK